MSLATRCPVCQTVFRVVQDQLKVSEGWVRCGRCAKVFNAFEGLFDLEREFPALRSPTPSQRVLEDLATRNRQPKQPSDWQDEFDTRSSVHNPSPATQPPPTQPPATRPPLPAASAPSTQPQLIAPRSLMPPTPAAIPLGARGPSPAAAPVTAPTMAAGSAPPRVIGTPPREQTATPTRAASASAATAGKDEGATIPPAAVVVDTPAPAMAERDRPAAVVASPVAAPAKQPAPPPPAATRSAARAERGLELRDEPVPLPGTVGEADSDEQDESFEALFRSDGEMAEPATAADGIDIMIDGGDVEPASLDDAVDSRLLTFVQEAERAERWRRPWVRVAFGLAALALMLLLGAQLLVAQRDIAVAQWPGTRSLVQALCAPLGCRIEALRRIDQLGVDSSGLTRIDDGPVYRLALVLRNRGELPLLLPAIDLSLTDAAGALVSRRMLSAADLGSARATIAAGQELPLQALLMSSDRVLTGYTIEIFYP